MAKETTGKSNNKAPAKPAHPPLPEMATRLGEIRDELDAREQAVLDAEALRDAAREHWDALHAAAFGGEFGVAAGGRGSDAEDKEGKPIPPNWDILMGDIPEPTEEE